jgi:hypothetical protein
VRFGFEGDGEGGSVGGMRSWGDLEGGGGDGGDSGAGDGDGGGDGGARVAGRGRAPPARAGVGDAHQQARGARAGPLVPLQPAHAIVVGARAVPPLRRHHGRRGGRRRLPEHPLQQTQGARAQVRKSQGSEPPSTPPLTHLLPLQSLRFALDKG